jgi:protein translocase SecG subunit
MNLGPFAPYLSVVLIILAVGMIALVLLQSKGSDLAGFLGGGGESGGSRTRRGVEATMHSITIYTSIAFFVITFLAFMALGQAN